MRMTQGFAAVADDAQAGNPVAKPAFAGFAGFAWVIVREGSFLSKIRYGGRERGASIASECKPRFAGFAVCTQVDWAIEPNPAPTLVLIGTVRNAEGANLGAYPVRRFAPRHTKRPRAKTQCWRWVTGDSPPDSGKLANE
jgi:hypothetical protein